MAVPIHFAAVLVAALVSYVLGAIWFGPIFGNAWKSLTGIPEMKPGPSAMILGFIGSLLMSYVLAHAMIFASTYLNATGVSAGLMGGFFNWLGFIAPVTLGVVIYEKKPWKLWFLTNSYWLLSLLVMGVILSVWK